MRLLFLQIKLGILGGAKLGKMMLYGNSKNADIYTKGFR